jgi:hypothetical protein
MKTSIKILCFVLIIATGLVRCDMENIFPQDPSSKISGNWQCNETSEVFGITTFSVIISRTGHLQEIEISNFYNLAGRHVIATVDGQDILISEQTVDGNIISGDGTISKDFSQIELYYEVDDQSGPIDHVNAVLSPL